MPSDVDLAIAAVADGESVDWSALDSGPLSDDERVMLKYLRVVDEIGELHRSTDDLLGGSEIPTVAGTAGPIDEHAEAWGRYRLLEQVGEGSFGSVYRAWDPELEREIGIKILHRDLADSQLRERLLREGRALAQVRHPNVVSVLGVESHGDRVGLCMEFVHGETLDAVLRTHGTLNTREAALVGDDVCRALAAVHGAGFVHRDVKTRNVMRDRSGRIVLMDFGTGRKTTGGQLAAGDIAGTPVYMAPEVLEGTAASPASDVYSVGVLLYHLVTAKYPFEGRTIDDLRAAHKAGRRRLLSERRSDLPLPFVQLVERATAAEPQKRYPSAAALLEALAAIDARPRSKARNVVTTVVGAAVGITVLGLLSTAVFDFVLGRSDFTSEGLSEWFVFGLRSSAKPVFVLMLAVLAVQLLLVLRRLAGESLELVRRVDAGVCQSLERAARRLHLDDVSVLASWTLLISASALIGAWWYFSDLIGAVFSHISTAEPEVLAYFSPGFFDLQDLYREVFTYIAIFSVGAWYYVWRRSRHTGASLGTGMLAGGLVVASLSMVSLDFPYRLFYRPNFKPVLWNESRCYLLGKRSADLLLFCPTLPPPRNRIVREGAPSVKELDEDAENISATFAQYRKR